MTFDVDVNEILRQARAELAAEARARRVAAAKERLRRPWWRRLFPYTITITIERNDHVAD